MESKSNTHKDEELKDHEIDMVDDDGGDDQPDGDNNNGNDEKTMKHHFLCLTGV